MLFKFQNEIMLKILSS